MPDADVEIKVGERDLHTRGRSLLVRARTAGT